MENNNVTPTPSPTPSPANNMPEFATAPAAPAPVIPPATAMPAFGVPASLPAQQPVVATPAPVETSVEAPAEQSAPVEQQPIEQQPAAPVQSTLGEITEEAVSAPAQAPIESQPTEPTPVTTDVPSPVESTSIPTSTPTPVPTPAQNQKKKPNYKLFALIGGGVLVLAGVIFAVVALTGQPKQTSNPSDAPVATYSGPDNSTAFSELNKEGALAYLTAVGKTTKYYPEDFIGESDSDILPAEGEAGSKLLISYETKDQAKQIAFDFQDVAFKAKYTVQNFKTTEKVDYTVVYVDQEKAECSTCARSVSFSNKIINRFFQPIVDPVTGTTIQGEFTFFTKNTKETVERYLPVVVYLTQDQILYSSEFKETDNEYQLIANVIYLGLDEEKMATAAAGEVPRAINLSTIYYVVDKTSGQVIVKSEMTPAGQLKAVKSFPVTDEEVKDLI